jgi:hypothetical protein
MPSYRPSTCPKRSCTELKSQPFPHRSPTTVARCRPGVKALQGDMAPLAAAMAALAAGTAVLAAGAARAAVEVEDLAALTVEAARAEVAQAGAVLTEEAEAQAEEAPVQAVLQAVAAVAIARIKTRISSKSGGWPRSRFRDLGFSSQTVYMERPGSHNLIGALSCISAMATPPARTAPVIYQAGANGLPVRSVSALMASCVEPPKTQVERA